MAQREYVVFNYQYNDMRSPKWNAYRTDGDRSKTVDCLPPTVIRLMYINASSKPEAIRKGRSQGAA